MPVLVKAWRFDWRLLFEEWCNILFEGGNGVPCRINLLFADILALRCYAMLFSEGLFLHGQPVCNAFFQSFTLLFEGIMASHFETIDNLSDKLARILSQGLPCSLGKVIVEVLLQRRPEFFF